MNWVTFLRKPAAFISANWAGLLCLVTVVGLVPALAGQVRVMSDLDEHADESGMLVFRQFRRTWLRDLPVTLFAWFALLAGVGTIWLLVNVFSTQERVFFGGVLIPTYWVVAALLQAWIRAAGLAPLAASRKEVALDFARLVLGQPLRTLGMVPVAIVTAPAWLLAPITVACGLSLPAWVMQRYWGTNPSPHAADSAKMGRATAPAIETAGLGGSS